MVSDIDSGNSMISPFGQLGLHLSDSDLRETAFEIFIAASRTPKAGRPLNYVSSSYSSLQKLTPPSKMKKVNSGEVMRVQMRISQEFDSRVRRALLRITAGGVILFNLLPFMHLFRKNYTHMNMYNRIQTNLGGCIQFRF